MKAKALAFLILFAPLAAQADIVSRFDAGDDGWQAANVDTTNGVVTYYPVTPIGGHIEASEQYSGLFLLAAPQAYLGDLSGYAGGSVSFRLSDTVADPVPHPALILESDTYGVMYFDHTPPGTSLTAFDVPLSRAGWQIGRFSPTDPTPTATQFADILAHVDRFAIDADWKTFGTDTVALDDVVVAPVPEPATLAALGLGIAGLGRRRPTKRG